MPTKMITRLHCFVSPLRSVVWCLSSVICFSDFSVWAGDLAVDNLTVSSNATVIGNMYFSSTAGGTNGGGTATGGTITTNGNYRIHTFTNVGTTSFVVSGGMLSCDVLVVAGGGGGNGGIGGVNYGAGGAGGTVIFLSSYAVSSAIAVAVGAGGTTMTNKGGSGVSGSNSVFGTNIATGGTGVSGASRTGGSNVTYSGGSNSAGTGAGGGAGGGGNGSGIRGGIGFTNSISGTTVGYAGGGGGGPSGTAVDGGGAGVGTFPQNNGVANTGGGGGGGPDLATPPWSSCGGSGIVIVRYLNTSSNITSLSISSNGISQTSTSGVNVLMGKVGIGTNSPAEKLHVVGNARVDGTNIVSAITLGGDTRTTWPTGNLSASNNLSDITNKAAARTNLGLGSAATNDASAFMSTTGNGSQITGITAGQVAGALVASNNLSDVANQAAACANLGALSATGGVVNGVISLVAPGGDIPMGVYTNQ